MTPLSQRSAPRARLGTLRRRLDHAGLPRWRRRPARVEPDLAARARDALLSLGPLYAALASYLATRLDLLPLRDSLELGLRRAATAPTPPEAVSRVLAAAGWRGGSLPVLDPEPLRVSSLFQWHRAEAPEGGSLRVQLLRPELRRQLDEEWPLLPEVLARRLWSSGERPPAANRLLADFAGWIEAELDLGATAAGLGRIRGAAADHGALAVARAVPEWSGPGVLTTRLDGAEPLCRKPSPDPELARRLAFGWLHLALLGGFAGADLDEVDWATLPGQRVGILGGRWVGLDRPSRRALLSMLVAAAHHEPDRSGELLRRLSDGPGDRASRDMLRVRLRQAEPFRSGGLSDRYAGERLADVLYVHWRLAREVGLDPGPALGAFQVGLVRLDRITRPMAPDRDVLEQAMADVRVVSAAVEVRRSLAPSRVPELATRLLAAVEDTAHHVDRLDGTGTRSNGAPCRTAGASSAWLRPLAALAAAGLGAWALEAAFPLARLAGSAAIAATALWFGAALERGLGERAPAAPAAPRLDGAGPTRQPGGSR